jgi:hypothetical protein
MGSLRRVLTLQHGHRLLLLSVVLVMGLGLCWVMVWLVGILTM